MFVPSGTALLAGHTPKHGRVRPCFLYPDLNPSRIGRVEAELCHAEGGGGGGGCEKYIHEDALKLPTYGIPGQLAESYAQR